MLSFPGPTGLEPTQTSFLQALDIPSKISKGQIEIEKDVKLLTIGDKVGNSEAALLKKLNINPFTYGLEVVHVYDEGTIYGAEVLDLTDEIICTRFAGYIQYAVCLALGAHFPTAMTVPHTIRDAFKNLLAIAVETDYDFPLAEPVKAYLADPSAFAAAAPAATEAAAEEAAAESESEDDDMGFSLFD